MALQSFEIQEQATCKFQSASSEGEPASGGPVQLQSVKLSALWVGHNDIQPQIQSVPHILRVLPRIPSPPGPSQNVILMREHASIRFGSISSIRSRLRTRDYTRVSI